MSTPANMGGGDLGEPPKSDVKMVMPRKHCAAGATPWWLPAGGLRPRSPRRHQPRDAIVRSCWCMEVLTAEVPRRCRPVTSHRRCAAEPQPRPPARSRLTRLDVSGRTLLTWAGSPLTVHRSCEDKVRCECRRWFWLTAKSCRHLPMQSVNVPVHLPLSIPAPAGLRPTQAPASGRRRISSLR